MSFKRAGQYHEQRMDPLSVKGGKIDRFFKKKKPDHGIEAGKDHRKLIVIKSRCGGWKSLPGASGCRECRACCAIAVVDG